ncbi:ABC transporter permease [Rugosimonospora africana]|uniref:Peptide ABC transporter permease n=1 Tax=Rugosimonospora africana TaxID=556532 RepID=A0A8J3QM58_9ACTN|nr:ABC transporter permease [Rugosimonospora africana]GIH12008.1 peptide ABC transporter permease [Rugosimonospora africana]
MLAYTIRRVLISVPVLLGSTILVFIMVKLSGDPLESIKLRNPPPPPQTIKLEEHRLGLDQSWPLQYWNWLKGLVLHGNFGAAVQPSDNIGSEIGSHLWVTMRLVFFSVLIALILAIITGVLSAVKQYSALDYTTTFFGFLFLSMPVFWFAVLLKSWGIWYNQNVSANTFYTIGDKSVVLENDTTWGHITDVAGHMVLPTIVLGLAGYAGWTRFTRASMLEVLNSDHVRLARAKGLRSRKVLVRHALRNALIPLTTVTALDIAALLGGAILTETVFQWQGMGALFVQSLRDKDAHLMMGWLLVSATIVILFNLIADLLYGVLDPRIRHA